MAIVIDFCKAFDCCNHSVIIQKLCHYGFRNTATNLLKSYLENRMQFVKINKYVSKRLCISNGVPQGSILGPLLFLMYINDLAPCILYKDSFVVQFADDSTVICSGQTISEIESIANETLKRLNCWVLHNKMAVNADKTNTMLFTPSSLQKSVPSSIKFQNVTLATVEQVKILGVTFDSKLSFKQHIGNIRQTLAWKLSVLHRIKHLIPISVKRKIYYAHFHSHVYYCNLIWGQACYTNLVPLIKLQKRAVRIITNSSYRAHTV